jgi:hypothetical protein
MELPAQEPRPFAHAEHAQVLARLGPRDRCQTNAIVAHLE